MAKDAFEKETIAQSLKNAGYSRRDFIQLCTTLVATAPMGLALTENATPAEVAKNVGKAKKPSVVWLHFQDCTGCSESLLRTSKPDVADLIINLISLDYHETLMVACGDQAEAALKSAVEENAGKFVLVVEGSIPRKDKGVYMMLGGKPAIDVLKETASKAAAIIAMGSCASWGGVPSADPNPTDATGVDQIITDKPIVNIPGCPPNPYTLLGVVLEYAVMGKLPACDSLKRPKFSFDRVIHDHCPRRAHFDAGRFADGYGTPSHRQGYCLFKLGCKGPVTHAGCSTRHFNEIPDCWPIGLGAPCFGCTEKGVGFTIPLFDRVDAHGFTATPPDTYAPISSTFGKVGAGAALLVGLASGALAGASWAASQKLASSEETIADEAKTSGGK
ncbi:MAG: hydrogenase small subunit [Acidobacteriota bacterium]|nr:hydrogenase small subunit [Acidobacteriota bacterium]